MQQLSAQQLLALVQQVVEDPLHCRDEAAGLLSKLLAVPAAAEVPPAQLVPLLHAAINAGGALALEWLLGLPAARGLPQDELGPFVAAAVARRLHVGLWLLLQLAAAQQLSAAEVTGLLVASAGSAVAMIISRLSPRTP